MKLYVAGKYTDRERVSEIMRILEKQGHEIVFDWTKSSNNDFREVALEDLRAIKEADAFYLVYSNELQGAWTELGAALAYGLPCYVTYEAIHSHNVFLNHPLIRPAYEVTALPFNQKAVEKYSAIEMEVRPNERK
ncbi:hypothetical protein LCGC14_0264510 [marine sediment metagenome]|uniref:Nucleoside 2-deoxyribosyltransferase n=1 Tax=marine sediment metagenome TaxID=412755 RepID=A0A0F9U5L1_9ZZZZ